MNDSELLRRYVEHRCEASFTELVNRYLDLVYSTAIRQVGGDAHLAHDVTQSVFIDLARKAASLSSRTVLTGWLYTSTRYAAAKTVRTEQRWHAREQEAHTMQELSHEPPLEPRWEELRPVLDDVMHELNERDRNAILLRYFEGRHLSEVGAKLGLSEDAARKRVGRALDKFRERLVKRGVTSTTAALAALLPGQTIMAAPAGMAATIASATLASVATGTTVTALKLITMTKLKLGVISALALAGVTTVLLIQHQAQIKLREENQSLRQQNDQLIALEAENIRLSNLVVSAKSAQSDREQKFNELPKLRGEVARLRADAQELARLKAAGTTAPNDASFEATLQTIAIRASQLKQRLEQMPDKKIPELQLLTDKDWLQVAGNVKRLETDDDFRQALSDLRARAKLNFGLLVDKALRKYADANGGMLPTDLSQLQPYFETPLENSLLQRYQLMQAGKLRDAVKGKILMAETAPTVDDEYDTNFAITGNGGTYMSGVNKVEDALRLARDAYAHDNRDLLPKDPSHLLPYLQKQIDPAKVQKFLNQIPSNVTTLEQLLSTAK